jgi:hypothetical protein
MKMTQKRRLLIFLWLLCFVILILLLHESHTYSTARIRAEVGTRASIRSEMLLAAAKLSAYQRGVEKIVNSLALELGTRRLNEKELEERLREAVRKDPHIFRIGAAFEPGMGPVKGLYAPHYGIRGGRIRFFRLEESLDYTRQNWYRDTIGEGARWSEPYYGVELKSPVAGFAAPFFRPGPEGEKIPAGVVRVTFSPDGLDDLVYAPQIRKSGHTVLISKKGTLITSPLRESVESGKRIFDLPEREEMRQSARFKDFCHKALTGERDEMDLLEHGAPPCWLFLEPVPCASWSLVGFYVNKEAHSGGRTFRQQRIRIAVGFIVFLTFLLALLNISFRTSPCGLWVLSHGFSLLCFLAACFIWYLALSVPLEESYGDFLMTSKSNLARFINEQDHKARSLHRKPPVFIPTGLHIQVLEFSEPNNLKICGYVWQKYGRGVARNISRGFTLPETKSLKISEEYGWRDEGLEVLGWRFEAEIREFFDYSKYPFDRQNIWIWLRHKDLDKNVMLVPDLESFKLLTPLALPGLHQGLVLPGYTILGAFFDFRPMVSSTDFGITNHSRAENFPELFYNIIVSRNFITPFISWIFPVFIILSILFIVLLKFSGDEALRKSYGLSGLAVIGVIIALLLPLLLAQIHLRQNLDTERIIFVEYFYLITYLVLLLVAIAAYLFTGKRNMRVIQYGDCLAAKLIYWPIVTLLLLVLSLVNFY